MCLGFSNHMDSLLAASPLKERIEQSSVQRSSSHTKLDKPVPASHGTFDADADVRTLLIKTGSFAFRDKGIKQEAGLKVNKLLKM